MLSNYLDKTFQLSILGYRNTLEKILLSVNKQLIFIDIGANQGIFSLIASKNKNFIEIHAFEPNLNLITHLESNFNRNKVDNFIIHKVAIGSRTGSVPFFALERHSGTGRLSAETSNMHVTCANRDYLDKVFPNVKNHISLKLMWKEPSYLQSRGQIMSLTHFTLSYLLNCSVNGAQSFHTTQMMSSSSFPRRAINVLR
jgi:FkbM family methyltransferase